MIQKSYVHFKAVKLGFNHLKLINKLESLAVVTEHRLGYVVTQNLGTLVPMHIWQQSNKLFLLLDHLLPSMDQELAL
jgi:hypothetical protein